MGSRSADIWQYQYKSGDKISQYTFYTDAQTSEPISFHMFGSNYLTGEVAMAQN